MTKKLYTMKIEEVELAEWKVKAGERSLVDWIREKCNARPKEQSEGDFGISNVSRGGEVPAPKGRDAVPVVAGPGVCSHDFGYGPGKCPYGSCPNRNEKAKVRCEHGTEKGYRCWQCRGVAKC